MEARSARVLMVELVIRKMTKTEGGHRFRGSMGVLLCLGLFATGIRRHQWQKAYGIATSISAACRARLTVAAQRRIGPGRRGLLAAQEVAGLSQKLRQEPPEGPQCGHFDSFRRKPSGPGGAALACVGSNRPDRV